MTTTLDLTRIKLSDRESVLLKRLCECEPGKDMPLPKADRRVASALITKGAVWSVGFSKFEVFIATDDGRAALAKAGA